MEERRVLTLGRYEQKEEIDSCYKRPTQYCRHLIISRTENIGCIEGNTIYPSELLKNHEANTHLCI